MCGSNYDHAIEKLHLHSLLFNNMSHYNPSCMTWYVQCRSHNMLICSSTKLGYEDDSMVEIEVISSNK